MPQTVDFRARRRVRAVVSLAVAGVALTAISGLPAPSASAQQVTPCEGGGGGWSVVSRRESYEPMDPEIIELESELDGVTIQIGLIRPEVPRGVRVPVIVTSSPYFHPLGSMEWWTCSAFARLGENFVPQGYAVAVVPVRGSSDAGGCMNLMGPAERADLDQAVTWLGTQPWSNGAVGMAGKSYDGSTPWQVASFGNPHLKTIVPSEGVPSLFNLLFGAGTPDWRGPLVLGSIYYLESGVFYLPGRDPQHSAEVLACPEYVTGNLASVYSAQTGELDPFGYWEEREYLDDVERNYEGSIFLLQGLQDWNVNPGQQYPWVTELEREGPYVKHMLGQWTHQWPDQGSESTYRADFADILLDWFDYWLKGDRSLDLGPGAEVQDSRGDWRTEPTWPPPGAKQILWLAPGGELASKPPTGSETLPLILDPVHTQDPAGAQGSGADVPDLPPETCEAPFCAQFGTGEFEEDFHFAGLPRVRLRVTPMGPAGLISVYLYGVTGDEWERLGWGQVDLRFPHGDREAAQVTPGQEMAVDFLLQPLDAVVPAGGRLVMIVSEGNTYNRLPEIPNFPLMLEVGGKAGSLTITKISPKRGQYFKPPGSDGS